MISKHLYFETTTEIPGFTSVPQTALTESQAGCCHVGLGFTCNKLKFLWSFAPSITCWMPLTAAELMTAFTVTNIGLA